MLIIHVDSAPFRHHPDDVETLFLLLRAFLERHISTNHLLYSYLESTVATTYTIAQRRNIFFKFVEVFGRHDYSQEHKAKVIFEACKCIFLTPLPPPPLPRFFNTL